MTIKFSLDCPHCKATFTPGVEVVKAFERYCSTKAFNEVIERGRLAALDQLNFEAEKKDEEKVNERVDLLVKAITEPIIADNHSLKKKIERMTKKNGEAVGIGLQGSQKDQGDVGEEALLDILCRLFPVDQFDRLGAGERGYDVVQAVRSATGLEAGTIVWESKNTKSFHRKWITKLKNDRDACNAAIAVLVTKAMPPKSGDIAYIDGIVVISFDAIASVAELLRDQLIALFSLEQASISRDEKLRKLHTYWSEGTLVRKLDRIFQAKKQLALDHEKKAKQDERFHSSCQQHLEQIGIATTAISQDLDGIIEREMDPLNGFSRGVSLPEEIQLN